MGSPTSQHPLRLQYLLLSFFAGVLLSSSTCQAASDKMVLTACEDKRGYETLAGTRFLFRTGEFTPLTGQDGQKFATSDLAVKACNADSNCIAFDNFGSTAKLGRLEKWLSSAASCTYVKRIMPKKSGFRLRLFTQALPVASQKTASAAAAEAACRASANCTSWASDGTYTTDPITSFVPSLNRLVTYEKIACDDKFGYMSLSDVKVVPVDGVDNGATEGTTDKTEVEEFCKLNYQCTSIDSDGHYVIGGVGQYVDQPGLCTWVKNPCAPMRGFVAHNDVAYKNMEGLLSRPAKDCFTGVYTECLGNPNCRSFNNMRYMFGPNQPSVSTMSTESAPGMCLYVKIADGSSAA